MSIPLGFYDLLLPLAWLLGRVKNYFHLRVL